MNYAAHYAKLIDRTRGRSLVGYRERHHVVPKCVGGTNDPENIVELTGEEHYVAHQLLVKIYPEVVGLAVAAVRMAKQCTGNKAYGWLRRRHGAATTQRMVGNKYAVGYRSQLGKKHSPETRAKLAVMSRGNKNWLGKKHSPETRAKLSAILLGTHRALGVKRSSETLAKMSAASLGNKHHLGHKHSPETRAKISATKRGLTFGATVAP